MKYTLVVLSGLVLVTALVLGCSRAKSTASPTVTKEGDQTYLIATDDSGVAVKGYDTVAYFNTGKPVQGSSGFVAEWRGAKWHFGSAENRDAFQANPEQYAPQYGGYCAWGVAAKNDLFEVDPEAWKIIDGKLYLNFNKEIQTQWLEDTAGFIKKADQNWPGLVQSKS